MADFSKTLAALQNAAAEKHITESALENIRLWLTAPQYAKYAEIIEKLTADEEWKALDDAFWTVIPFGTGGRRGRMFPVGTNVINDVTIGESAQGLASYVLEYLKSIGSDRRPSCAIAYDTRHRSREFAELCAGIMVANGFKVWFLDGYRSTPEMSFMVRYKKCDCGIMVTASHNPPSDNAVKVYWSTGGQVLPPHDAKIIENVMAMQTVKTSDFAQALEAGDVEYCQEEVDGAFIKAVLSVSKSGPRDLNIIYSPLHGVGSSCVLPALDGAGFKNVQLFGPHAEPSGDFPNVPNHVSNPENPAVFDIIIEDAKKQGNIDLILATDPDSDRLGVAAPLTYEPNAEWKTLTGNQIGTLMAEYLLSEMKAEGKLTPSHYVVETLVTTPMLKKIADAYGILTIRDLLVGFKYIGGAIEEHGPEKFVMGMEESYGFLVGTHARDKDAAVAAMVFSEMAAKAKAEGKTVHQKLEELYVQYGRHAEKAFSIAMSGSDGMAKMTALMERFQSDPPRELAGMEVVYAQDFEHGTEMDLRIGKEKAPMQGPKGKLVMLHLSEKGNCAAVRPSGTEPKVKFYLFASLQPGEEGDVYARLDALEAALKETLELE